MWTSLTRFIYKPLYTNTFPGLLHSTKQAPSRVIDYIDLVPLFPLLISLSSYLFVVPRSTLLRKTYYISDLERGTDSTDGGHPKLVSGL